MRPAKSSLLLKYENFYKQRNKLNRALEQAPEAVRRWSTSVTVTIEPSQGGEELESNAHGALIMALEL